MIKLEPGTITDMVLDSHARGVEEGARLGRSDVERRVQESTQALLAENNNLKTELSAMENRVQVQRQKDAFPAVYAEQLRIVKTIRKVLSKKAASDLLFKLALGDIGDPK